MKGAEPIFVDKNSKVGILLLHGFTSTPYQFKEVADYFAKKGFTIYVPLIVGHGTSPKDLMRTTMEDWQKSAKEAYLKLKERSQKIVVAGNSFGGNLAFYLARIFPDSTAGIISLGTPIWLKFHWLTKLGVYLCGWFKRYHRKTRRIYKIDYTDMIDEVTYPSIPLKSLKEFFKFIERETMPNLKNIKTPTFIMHANVDPVVNPDSAIYIYENLGSPYKRIYWFNSREHVVTNDGHRFDLLEKALKFIQEVTK